MVRKHLKTSKLKRINTILSAVFAIIAMVSFSGCHEAVHNEKILVVSIQPQKYLLQQIVGNKYNVKSLLTQKGNPETYEPSASNLVSIERSEAYFKIGNIGFELAVSPTVESLNPDLKIYDTSKGVDMIVGTHCTGGYHNHNKRILDVDPHIWSSAVNAKVIARNMYDAMLEIDDDNEKYYTRNFNKLIERLDSVDTAIHQMLDTVKGRSFMVWHPSLSYFARDYNLHQVSLEAIGKESSVKNFKERLDFARQDSVHVFLYQKEFDSRQADVILKDVDVRKFEINPMNYDIAEELINTAHAIASK